MAHRLRKSFYARDTLQIAQDLLGQRLVRRLPDGSRVSGRIVETEAYLGLEDPCCHTFGGRRTPRTEVMFGDAGLAYTYFIYGVHFCFNVVTVAKDVPEAVLIRALEPVEGLESMRRARQKFELHELANGPGKLCQALQLGRAQNGLDLTRSEELWIEEDQGVEESALIDGPRIGVGDRHDAVHWPLRFGIKNNPSLSPPKFPNYQG